MIVGLCLIVAILVWDTVPSAAFEKAKHHQYTRAAIDMYREMCGMDVSKARDAARERLADGARSEDDKSLARAGHWHFYDRDDGPRHFLFFRTTLDTIFEQRSRAVGDLLNQPSPHLAELYFAAGRVLHYVQDMSVPAHVVPIFHMKGLRRDPFDEYYPRDASRLRQVLDGPCEKLKANAPAGDPVRVFESLLRDTAKHTLSAIGQRRPDRPTPAPDTVRWHKYWRPFEPVSGVGWPFGSYGDCPFPLKPGTAEDCAKDDDLDGFFEARYRRVIHDTVKLLMYLERARTS